MPKCLGAAAARDRSSRRVRILQTLDDERLYAAQMETIANELEPPGFDLVRQAFETSRQLPAWRPGTVRIGLARADGRLVATGVLHDLRQARLFSIQMGGLGYREADGRQAQAADCDVVFAPRPWTYAASPVGDRPGAA